MEIDEIRLLVDTHPAWRLLRARNAPLVLAFLGRVFVEENAGALGQSVLAGSLEDFLHVANAGRPVEQQHTGAPTAYLDDWSGPDSGWLRRFYPAGVDEVHYDATPALEKAYGWVAALRVRASIGTESRLHTLVDLLRQMVHGAEVDPETRLAELRRRRDETEREIAEVQAGQLRVLDGAALRERYQFFSSTARELLADFREVEENFRTLDRGARERIATWDGAKGELLASLVGDRADIASSDQGRSFQAFYDFLLSEDRQDELSDLLARVQGLDAVEVEPRVRRVHHDWYDAAERTQATVRSLSEQLRRFLDDQVWVENRRVLDLVRRIETVALEVRGDPPSLGLDVDEPQLSVSLPLERPLYDVRPPSAVDSDLVGGEVDDLDTTALFDQTFVDTARLAEQVRTVVPPRSSALLHEILELYPLRDGVAELVGYLALSEADLHVELDEQREVTVTWHDADRGVRAVRMPEATVRRG
ncbi:MAG: DUF3375 domain-containing protein [Nocardioides marinisabuli]|uniref:DUF3375 domain-containing protein n=1 Tax=Nocardioides marinisabuli TaxID=419476 RepID=UPI00321AF8D4